MEISYQDFKDIVFPVFPIDISRVTPDFIDGLVLVGDLVLDDKNQKNPGLGSRRLHSPHPLYPLKKGTLFSIEELICSKYKTFIDNDGKVFYYKKTKFGVIKTHLIDSVSKVGSYSVVTIRGVLPKFKVRTPPSSNYVQVLYIAKSPLGIVGFSDEMSPNVRRKV